jgi:hypothetical protein
MGQHLVNVVAVAHIPVEHAADEIDALLTHDERYAQVSIHNLVDAVKGVLLVDYGVEQDTQSPDVLLFTTIRLSSQDLWGSIVWETPTLVMGENGARDE